MKRAPRLILFAILPLLAFGLALPLRDAPSAEAAPACPIARADVTGDGVVNMADLSLLAGSFLKNAPSLDQDGDNVITLADLSRVSSNFLKRTSDCPPDDAAITVPGLPALEATMLTRHNEARATAGIAPLTVNPALTQIARLRSQDMAVNNYFSHNRPGESTPHYQALINAAGLSYSWLGENIAWNKGYSDSASVEAAFTGLMNSTGHRTNILRPEFTQVGIGAVRAADGGIYYTIVFMTPR